MRAAEGATVASTVGRGRSTPSSSISTPIIRESKIADVQPDEIGAKGVSKQPTTANFLSQWWKELFAIFASVAFLIAVFAVLLNIDNTRLANWSMPFDMQPTALIAVLTTLSRVFLLAMIAEAIGQLKWKYFQQRPQRLDAIETFDSASRGALGSIAFLGKSPWKALLASLGAMMTILVLAMVSRLNATRSTMIETTIIHTERNISGTIRSAGPFFSERASAASSASWFTASS